MSKTTVSSFKDLLFIEMGQSPKAQFVNVVGEGVPLLNGPAEFTSKHPIPKQFTIKGNRFSEPLDILFCVRGSTTGRMNIADQKYAIGRGLAAIRHREGSHLNAFVRGLIEQNLVGLLGGSMGSVFPNLTKDQLLDYKCVVPDIIEQHKIAKILSDLDAKIELNNKINTVLEAMAKLIYDYWFVQFDFPDKNAKPYKSSGGLMVYNKELKREIPEGWEVMELSELETNIVTGKTPSTKIEDNFNGDIPFICIGDVRGNMHITNTELTLSEKGANTQINKYIPEGAICVTCIASPGLVAFATRDSQTNQQLNTVVCDKFENRYFLYFYLLDYFKFAKAKTGNTFANMNKGDFSSIKVIKPNSKVLINFSNKLKSSIDKVLINSKENQKLSELRDWLLPMLMNGQVRVGEVDKIKELI